MKKPLKQERRTNTDGIQAQDKEFITQMKIAFAAFAKSPKTMLMASAETGVLRANLCRYIANWQRIGKIVKLREGVCEISKCQAGYYTTDPRLFPPESQLKMFDE